MQWTDAQRRALLNLWCRVARADGVVDDAEIDRLSQLFYRLDDGAIGADEVDRWLEHGPPDLEVLLPAEARPIFLEQAQVIMAADGKILPLESELVRELAETYFRKG